MSAKGSCEWREGGHTGISNLDLDHAALERLPIEGQGFLEAFEIGKFYITEALGAHHLSIFDDSNAGDVTALKEFRKSLIRSIIREITQMGCKRGPVREPLGFRLADRIAYHEISHEFRSNFNDSLN